jgi:DNA polymerase-3 subunit delta'
VPSDYNWSLIGNERALAALEPAIASAEPAHAYLFAGPAGVGKGLAAREFAAALNCEGSPKPCRQCRNCRDTLEEGRMHPDFEWVAPGSVCDETEHADHSGSRDIRICQVRRLQRVLSMTPYRGGWRIAVIDDADRLNQDASNAFLKTLEEPPAATVLILMTDREEHLLETVLSRCRRIAFTRVEREKVEAALKATGAGQSQVTAIAALANGRVGWALRAVEDAGLLQEREAFLRNAVEIANSQRAARLLWARAAGDERGPAVRERYLRELEVWEPWWRDVLALGSGAGTGIINIDKAESLAEEAKKYTPADIVRFLRVLQQTREYLQANVDAQLALEVLAMDVPQPRAATASRT